jgi:co-chaperonin GroES (HSP10)
MQEVPKRGHLENSAYRPLNQESQMTKQVEITDNRVRNTPSFDPPKPILDRVLIKRIVTEEAPDGFVVPEKYRQHTNVGSVVAVGQFVVLGGIQVPLTDLLKVGDRVHFGEYNSEKFEFDNVEYELVRIQNIRLVEPVNE